MTTLLTIFAQKIIHLLDTLNIKCDDSDIDDLIVSVRFYKNNVITEGVLLKEVAEKVVEFAIKNKHALMERDEDIFRIRVHDKVDLNLYISKYINKFSPEEKKNIWQILNEIIVCAANIFS